MIPTFIPNNMSTFSPKPKIPTFGNVSFYFIMTLSFLSLLSFSFVEHTKSSPRLKALLFYLQFLGYIGLSYIILTYILHLRTLIASEQNKKYENISQSVLSLLFNQ